MANVLFTLRGTGRGNKPQPIYVEYYFGHSSRLSYPIGLKCEPSNWSKRTHRVKPLALNKSKDAINKQLNDLSDKISEWITSETTAKRKPSKETLRSFLDSIFKPQTTGGKRGKYVGEVDSFIDSFIDKSGNRTNVKTGRKVGRATLYSYNRAFRYFREFEANKRLHLSFSDIGLMFYEEYTEFLQGRGLSVNSIGREIKTLKIFFNDAVIQGKEINKEYFKKGVFKVTSEEADNISLTEEELNRLYALDLSSNPTLDHVRDVFLVGCYTGLRYSDYSNLSSANVHGTIITLRQTKTDCDVAIPLHPRVKAILDKYNGVLPKSMRTGKPLTSQKFNKYLHKVCQTMLNGKPCVYGSESKRLTRGGVRVIRTLTRAEMVTSHTARRTFATLTYLTGMAATDIMRITGHKTEAAFEKYGKVSNKQAALKMLDSWKKNGEFIQIAK